MSSETRLAIYDLDWTITSEPTWTPFLLLGAWRLAPWRLLLIPVAAAAAVAHAVGAIGRDRLKSMMHRIMLGRMLPAHRATRLAEEFADRWVCDHIRPGALAQIATDREEGRRLVVATAAHRFYAQAIAARLGIADVVATEAARDARGDILPTLDGPNCHGPAKLTMIERWVANEGIDRRTSHVRFYSDHVSDRPTFDWSDEPVAVNPRRTLRNLAIERGWRIVDWRAVS